MNISVLLVTAVIIFIFAYVYYGSYLTRIFGINKERRTPAVAVNDGMDFVPTKSTVLFAHHFSAIAGAGPIVGPTIALFWGYAPVWLWIVIGAIFFGAMHDYAALFVSVREGGRSMAEVAGKTLGKTGFLLFIGFTTVMVVLVTAAFLGLTVKALTSLAPLSILGLSAGQTILKTSVVNGIVMGRIGGIASTSVIIMTMMSPVIGYFIYIKKTNINIMALAAMLVAVLSIVIGFIVPVSIPPLTWMMIISIYTLIAAGVPVWIILQPRDFINVYVLYAGIFFMFFGIIIAAIKGAVLNFPAFNVAQANMHPDLGMIWPVMFITVACGAISGFHALVAGGTTAKQINNESHIKFISFFGMLLEALLAVCVVITVAYGLNFKQYIGIVFPDAAGNSNPILAFSLANGNLLNFSFGIPAYIGTVFGILMVEGFIITTLDTAVRLNRYLLEELWPFLFKDVPKMLSSYFFNSGLCVAMMFLLAYTNAYLTIWPIFGTGNQLLASLTLFSIAVWLINRGARSFFVVIPAVFMLVTTLASLFMLMFGHHIPAMNIPLITVDLILFVLSLAMISEAVSIMTGYQVGFSDGRFSLIERRKEDMLADKAHIG